MLQDLNSSFRLSLQGNRGQIKLAWSELTEELTIEAIVDELYVCLMKQKSLCYQRQACDLIYRIPVYKPPPIFEIKISDLNEQVKKELDDRWRYKRELNYILKETVSRMFANVDERYFLLSVKRLLQVRLVP
jgi:hypothetical protein